MAPKNKVVVSSGPTNYRLSSKERHAAHLAEISGKQSELKAEAAARRAKREAAAAVSDTASEPAPTRQDAPST
jgi:hypothetical protein